MIDQKALKILHDTYWDRKSGWKRTRATPPEDFEYAKSKGAMFDPIAFSHDILVAELVAMRDQIAVKTVADAFIASLTTRRLDLRSALGSFAFASYFPVHALASSPRYRVQSGAERCEICGFYSFSPAEAQDLNVLNFERHKWGGVRNDDLVYAWFDLSEFNKSDPVEPTESDMSILRKILSIAAGLPSDARPGVLAKSISGLLKSNEAERRKLIEILSLCGVLQPSDHSGYFSEFTWSADRTHTSEHRNDWGYPARWWRGADGVNAAAVHAYFPNL